MLELSDKIHTVFFTLGFACNFKCKYCLQFGIKEKYEPDKWYNTDIIKFIKIIADKRKKSGKEKLYINFFGGEPLLYFNIIKDAVSKMKDMYVSFGMITNGSLITSEIADFLNENNFSVAISWDGRNTEKTRLIDVFKTNKENIFKLNKIFISGVGTAYSYPKDFLMDVVDIDEEYKRVHNTNDDIGWNLDTLYNFNNPEQSDVFNIDFNRLAYENKELAHNYITQNGKNHPIEDIYISRYVNQIKDYKEYDVKLDNKKYSMCMNGISIVNLDMDGNLYLCHDSLDKKLGTIYSSYDEYMNNYFKYNKIAPEYFKETCKDCKVRFICNGGCMILSKEERDNFYCPQRLATFGPIIDELLSSHNIY